MASLLLIFALVLGIAGGFLLYYDRTQRATDAQRDTASQQDTAAGESDNSGAEQSQGEKPQHNGKDQDAQGDQDTWVELGTREDQGAPFRAATDTDRTDHTDHTDDTDHADGSDEDAEGAPDTEGTPDAKTVAELEDEAATESSSSFAAKYSPSPDIEFDSSSATSSGRHHRTADDAHRSASDTRRASESEALSENDVVKGNTTTPQPQALHPAQTVPAGPAATAVSTATTATTLTALTRTSTVSTLQATLKRPRKLVRILAQALAFILLRAQLKIRNRMRIPPPTRRARRELKSNRKLTRSLNLWEGRGRLSLAPFAGSARTGRKPGALST